MTYDMKPQRIRKPTQHLNFFRLKKEKKLFDIQNDSRIECEIKPIYIVISN